LLGWASNSRYAFLGAIRSAAQMVSYEVSIGLIIMNLLCITGSLNLRSIVEFQEHIWFIVPFFSLFILFFISSLAETNRTPFDLPEAEGELVAGFNVEYSSTTFALFFIGEYANIFFMATLSVFLFFGGWLMPDLSFSIPTPSWFTLSYLSLFPYMCKIFIFYKDISFLLKDIYLIFAISFFLCYNVCTFIFFNLIIPYIFCFNLFLKALFWLLYCLTPFILPIKINIMVFLFIWMRATVPRYRYDFLMHICWRVFLPLSFGFLLITSSFV